jgi:hypothetical protein
MDSSILSFIEKSARIYLTSKTFFIVPDLSDPGFFNLKNKDQPALVVSREFGGILETYSGSLQEDATQLSLWMSKKRNQLVPQLDTNNQNDVFDGKTLVVMAIVDPDDKGFENTLFTMRKSAKGLLALAKKEYEHVSFIWLDGMKVYSF